MKLTYKQAFSEFVKIRVFFLKKVILTLKSEENQQHFRHIMLFILRKVKMLLIRNNESNIHAVYGEGFTNNQTYKKGFVKLHDI